MLILKVSYSGNKVEVTMLKREQTKLFKLSSLDELEAALAAQGIYVKVDSDITLKELHRRLDAAL